MDGSQSRSPVKLASRFVEKKQQQQQERDAGLTSILLWVLQKLFFFAYGFFTLIMFLLLAFTRKRAFMTMSDTEKKDLAAARHRIWSLKNPTNGLSHKFCTVRSGIKLHYVISKPNTEVKGKTALVIFLHGFPDSWALWQQYLRSNKLKEDAVLVAMDLPGFGGSDSLKEYTPNTVLDSITEFIVQMRDSYLPVDDSDPRTRGPVIVAGHDWGALIGFRLASEAPQLADRFIFANSIHPPLAESNVRARLASAYQIFKTWTHQPLNVRLIGKAISNVTPLLRQLSKSGYVFVFNLPRPLASLAGELGQFWFFRFLNAVTRELDPNQPLKDTQSYDMLAGTLGPGYAEFKNEDMANGDYDTDVQFPKSVRDRAPTGGWFEKLRVYREGLAFGPWEKSLETLWDLNQLEQTNGRRRSSSKAGLFELGPEGSLRAPTTVIWGKNDVAIENAIALDGINDYFGIRSSQLLMLSKCGHWLPIDKQGFAVCEDVLQWAIGGEQGTLKERFGDRFPLLKVITEA